MEYSKKTLASLGARFAVAALAASFLYGCASSGAQTVPRSISGKVQQVESGTVISTRIVVIDGETTRLGQTSGAVIGAAVGQTVGKGSGRTLATAGAGVAGAVVGSVVEKELTKKKAQELTINLDDGGAIVVIQEIREGGFGEGDRVNVSSTPSGEAHVSHVMSTASY